MAKKKRRKSVKKPKKVKKSKPTRKGKKKMTKKYDKKSESFVVADEEAPVKAAPKKADPDKGKLKALLKAIQDCKDLPGSDFDLRDIEAAVIKRLEATSEV